MPLYIEGKGYVRDQSDLPGMLAAARNNSDSWRRCQWLAEVAWFIADDKKSHRICDEALDAARQQREPNRVVTVAAWPLSVMVKRGHPKTSQVAEEMLAVILQEPHSVRRGDGLLTLFEAVYFHEKLRKNVLGRLLQTCRDMNSWKRGQILADTAVTLAKDEPETANQVLELLGENKFSRGARRQIEAGWSGPHQFIPYFQRLQPEEKI